MKQNWHIFICGQIDISIFFASIFNIGREKFNHVKHRFCYWVVWSWWWPLVKLPETPCTAGWLAQDFNELSLLQLWLGIMNDRYPIPLPLDTCLPTLSKTIRTRARGRIGANQSLTLPSPTIPLCLFLLYIFVTLLNLKRQLNEVALVRTWLSQLHLGVWQTSLISTPPIFFPNFIMYFSLPYG